MNDNERLEWPCQECGLCCKLIGLKHKEYSTKKFPICDFLDNDYLCSIYEKRPWFCNIRETYEKKYSKTMPWEEFEQRQREWCKLLQTVNN